ncbi:hypothetical protein MRX96_008080 [Rhipicephalus microplus]
MWLLLHITKGGHSAYKATPSSAQQATDDSKSNHGTWTQDWPPAYDNSSTPACRPNPAKQLTAPAAFQPTWADKVAGKSETHAPLHSESLPQPVVNKIQFLERENAKRRKELNEIKVPVPLEPRKNTEKPATPAIVRGEKRRAAPEQADEQPLTMSSIMTHMTALLEPFRSNILDELNPIKMQSKEFSARFENLEAHIT